MKKYIAILLIAVTAFGCEDWLDVNTDPNNPTEVGPDLILPVAQNFTARWLQTDRRVSHLGNMFMANWSESAGFSWYNDEFQYRANATTFYANIFNQGYNDCLKQYSDLDDLDPEIYGAYVAISKIMKSYHFQILVDFYGDIPYSEALGRSDNASPAYDDAAAIYDDLIVQLTEAITLLTDAEASDVAILPGDDDTTFGGNLTSWKQFANTLKVRILTRGASAKGSAYVQAEMDAITAEGSGFISSDVVIDPGFIDEVNKQNPIWEDFGWDPSGAPTLTNNATCATDYIIDFLQSTNDPRIDVLYEQPATGHLGVPQGIVSSNETQSPALVSNIGPGILVSADQPAVIFTAAEHYLNLSELAFTGITGIGTAESLFDMGVTASFTSLGLTAGQAATYASQTATGYANASNKLEAIITQKWLAVNGRTAEQSWFDWSRTGFPAGLPISQEVPNLTRPFRLAYPASEVGANSANVPTQPDVFSAKIFWAN